MNLRGTHAFPSALHWQKEEAPTPESWLAMLPGVISQLEPERHEDFVAQILRTCDLAGVELAGCMCDEFIVAKNWI